MILRPCRHAGCDQLTDRRDGLCLNHARSERNERARQYPTSTQRGYGGDWPKIRRAKLAINPLCEECEDHGLVTLASEVHHRDHDTSRNEPSNLQSLCRRCHKVKHRGELFGRSGKMTLKS